MTAALDGPSPNTVWVPRLYKSHARHPLAASRTRPRVGRAGIRSETGGPSRCASRTPRLAILHLERPVHVLGDHGIVARRLVDLAQRGQRLGVARRARAHGDVAPQPA